MELEHITHYITCTDSAHISGGPEKKARFSQAHCSKTTQGTDLQFAAIQSYGALEYSNKILLKCIQYLRRCMLIKALGYQKILPLGV